MFELSIACKYLIPRWRQLSVSIISLVSILVIALVVWLIVVFFSVKDGLENGWVEKMVALTAPIRVTPTEKYYQSYYYLIDSISSKSDYALKSIPEKLSATASDPYHPERDEEVPAEWPIPDRSSDGSLKDLAQLALQSISTVAAPDQLSVTQFETGVAHLQLRFLRLSHAGQPSQQFLDHVAYVGSFDAQQLAMARMLLPPNSEDIHNLLYLQSAHGHPEKLPPIEAFYDEKQGLVLPTASSWGEPVLLPRSFRDGGARLGDQGHLSFYSPTVSSLQEQRVPVFVAGFYDPGIMPIGGKYLLASRQLVNTICSGCSHEDVMMSSGFNLRFDHLSSAPMIKKELNQALEKAGIAPYWNIQTYQEYDFTKDLIQQLQSEKNLFSLISIIIIIVACSNIISMLIILVNDKKLEIGILRSMGASSRSIAAIFGFCGMVMGALGSLIGTLAAMVTLRYINELVGMISELQGHDLFSPVFYGNILPSELSTQALILVITSTAFISLLAGIVPAMKASMLRPSAILRAE